MTEFKVGISYPIESLPRCSELWSTDQALFWNDCQGWWVSMIFDETLKLDFGNCVAEYWQPLPAGGPGVPDVVTS